MTPPRWGRSSRSRPRCWRCWSLSRRFAAAEFIGWPCSPYGFCCSGCCRPAGSPSGGGGRDRRRADGRVASPRARSPMAVAADGRCGPWLDHVPPMMRRGIVALRDRSRRAVRAGDPSYSRPGGSAWCSQRRGRPAAEVGQHAAVRRPDDWRWPRCCCWGAGCSGGPEPGPRSSTAPRSMALMPSLRLHGVGRCLVPCRRWSGSASW